MTIQSISDAVLGVMTSIQELEPDEALRVLRCVIDLLAAGGEATERQTPREIIGAAPRKRKQKPTELVAKPDPSSKEARDAREARRVNRVSGKLVEDAVDYLRRHGGRVKTRDYAAARGLSVATAGWRFRAAAKAGMVHLEGSTNSAVWVLEEAA